MPYSQFTIYSSVDPSGPGPLTGTTGSLINVLDACLVNGYSGKPAAGWTKPLGNVSASCVSAYKQPSGSQFTLFVNDNAPNAARIAEVTGWVSASTLVSASNANNVGAGWGQFPLPSQALTVGRVGWFKSATSDTAQRNWIIAADAYTMYIWFADGQSTGFYYHGGFGDFYSQYGTSDAGRCLLYGKYSDTVNTIGGLELTDTISSGWAQAGANSLASYLPGHYIARSPFGSGPSIRYTKKGEGSCSATYVAATGEAPVTATMTGIFPAPNPTDLSFYFSPIWIVDPSSTAFRGRYRGIYQVCHQLSNFTNGQIIQGTGKFAGKSFMIILEGYNGGMWALDVSNTVETN